MKRARRAALAHHAGFGLMLLFLYWAHGRVGSDAAPNAPDAPAAEDAIRHWKEGPRAVARQMIAEYGPPQQAGWRQLRWTDNGPWVQTIVHRSAFPRVLGPRKRDWLEQTVSYLAPVQAVDDIHAFDERVEVNRRAAQMSSRSPDEPTNILLLNLAQEVASGRRDVRSARELAARTEALAKEGKTSVYTQRLLFRPRSKRSHAPAMVPAGTRGYTEPQKGGPHE